LPSSGNISKKNIQRASEAVKIKMNTMRSANGGKGEEKDSSKEKFS